VADVKKLTNPAEVRALIKAAAEHAREQLERQVENLKQSTLMVTRALEGKDYGDLIDSEVMLVEDLDVQQDGDLYDVEIRKRYGGAVPMGLSHDHQIPAGRYRAFFFLMKLEDKAK
jgi:hypothetical protein